MVTEYYYADPTGNITLLAPLPADGMSLQDTARQLMALEPDAEQVGFFREGETDSDICLRMAGGEFCGNATLSAAAVYCLQHPAAQNGESHLRVRVSGTADPVSVSIRPEGSSFRGAVSMPAPLEVTRERFSYLGEAYDLSRVRFEGITHLISFLPIRKNTAEEAVIQWCGSLNAGALGIIQIDAAEGTLLPLVYVRESRTLFWESSCASGTAAAGAVLREKLSPGSWTFREPAGSLRIDAPPDGSLLLHGRVRIEKKNLL